MYLAEDLKFSEHNIRAVKIINKNEVLNASLSEYNIELLLKLDHPNLVKIYDIIEDEKNLYIVQDYCEGGDLFSFIVKNKLLNENFTKIITKQVLIALNYLHNDSINIVHRDIKPENILIFRNEYSTDLSDIVIKISDYGLSSFFTKDKKISQISGAPLYTAPEVCLGKYDHKCDLWSTGVIAYTMLAGRTPYAGKDYDVLFKVLHQDYEFPDTFSDPTKEFLSLLLNKDPLERIDTETALEHEWMQNIIGTGLDEGKAVEILQELAKFSVGKNLRKGVLSYILTRKLYSENNDELYKLFKEIDVNNDGKIDKEELFNKYGKHFPGTEAEQWGQVCKFVDNMDINKSGKIEFSEFLTISSIINKEMDKKQLKDAFEFFDYDKNGYIEANDLREIFEDTDMTDEILQNILDEYDDNGDRKISYNEFCDLVTKNI